MSSASDVVKLLERGNGDNLYCDLVLCSPVEKWRPWYRCKLEYLDWGKCRLSSSCYADTPTIDVDFVKLSVCPCDSELDCRDIMANVDQETLEALRNANIQLYDKLTADSSIPHDVRGARNLLAVDNTGFIM